jgi:hypothetical protein
MTQKTCLIISHKKAAFSICNKEVRIENGRLKTMKNDHPSHYSNVCSVDDSLANTSVTGVTDPTIADAIMGEIMAAKKMRIMKYGLFQL